MCEQQEPASVGDALVMLDRALGFLAAADAPALTAAEQAQSLLALERAESRHTAARARMLAAFAGQDGYAGDGHGNARTWLRWRTRITKGAAAGAVGWARRLAGHPVISSALASGTLSASWAREICGWTDRLPAGVRDDADAILAEAARGGADLADLAGLAQEMYERSHQDEPDPGDPADDRGVWLDTTLGGAGRLTGDLTPGCAAAVAAVLESLGRKAGPEDARSAAQRRHDALEEACRRLIAAAMLPARAGQPTQAQVHLTLSQLRNLPGAAQAEQLWLSARARQPGWLSGPDAEAAACDATVAPVVTGNVDRAALDRLVRLVLHGPDPDGPAPDGPTPDGPTLDGHLRLAGTGRARGALSLSALARLREGLLALAADVLSGPGGLAAWLRQTQLGSQPGSPLATASLPLAIPLPLDSGEATPTIPAHLRRAVTARHPGCAFAGCDQPASVCQIHHLVPRSQGGPTALHNLAPFCTFHHLVVIHRWGWTVVVNPDGTTTATSPDGTRILHSHGPPAQAA